MIVLTEAQANELFTILVEKGNFGGKDNYVAYKREEFVEMLSERGVNEYWYPTASYSNMKLLFQNFSAEPVTVLAQTLSVKDKEMLVELKAAVKEFSLNLR